jgi:transposase
VLPIRSIFCGLNGYRIYDIRKTCDYFQIDLAAKRRTALCPRCRRASPSIHSRYIRTLVHVPITLTTVRICLLTRRFRCRKPFCDQRIFAERAEDLGRPYARTTESNRTALQRIGGIAGSNPGQRIAKDIGIPTSATTLRRRILETPTPEHQSVRVLGVDDWAWCKGRRYGTLLCDLETGRIVDLLPDRSADSLSAWLTAHPGVEIISRDRASCYAEGSQQGAPNAIQVADRWHLLHNMTDALEKIIFRHHPELKRAADQVSAPGPSQDEQNVGMPMPSAQEINDTQQPQTDERPQERQLNRAERERLARRGARAQRYDRVIELRKNGLSERAITRETGVSRRTVRKYLAAGTFPEINPPARRSSRLDVYEELIRERLAAGATVKELLQELRGLGHSGSESALERHIRRRLKWRKRFVKNNEGVKPKCPSPRAISIMMLQEEDKRSDQDNAFLWRLTQNCAELGVAGSIATDFSDIIRNRQPERYDGWRQQVNTANIREVMSFAQVLDRDRAAVIAGLTLPWSNGPTEGHINRLKSIKRQMYGRAGFEMLRKRVLIPP